MDVRGFVKGITKSGFRDLLRYEKAGEKHKLLFAAYRELYETKQMAELEAEDHTAMLGILALNRNPWLSAKFVANVIGNMTSNGHRLDMRDHHLVLCIYYRSHQFDLMHSYFDRMRNTYLVKPSIKAFNFIMGAYTQQNNVAGVVATWKSMVSAWPAAKYVNQEAWAFLILAHAKAGKPQEAEKSFLLISRKVAEMGSGKKVDAGVVDAMVSAYIMASKLDQARALFDSLGYTPGGLAEAVAASSRSQDWYRNLLVSFDSIIQSLFDAGEIELAFQYFDRLEGMCSAVDAVNGLSETSRGIEIFESPQYTKRQFPLPSTVDRIIAYYSSQHDPEMVVSVHKTYATAVRLSPSSNEHAVWAYLDLEQTAAAVQLFDRMLEQYQSPPPELIETIESHRHDFLGTASDP
ncbi:hypothetical protein HDU91_004704 [Kappamyces sp. JEL0680]|nr:hypothetical protein HDU91_004704 [Kappamyces sp. JEL0680]